MVIAQKLSQSMHQSGGLEQSLVISTLRRSRLFPVSMSGGILNQRLQAMPDSIHSWKMKKIRASCMEEFDKDNVTLDSNVFTSVPFSAVDRNWKMVGRVQWRQEESMPVLESRAALFGVKHLVRRNGNHGTRMLIFTDSMTSACAVSKGRAQTWRLRTVVQKIGALLLATGSSLSMRWVPSEWNPSDGPSRGLFGPSVPCRVPCDDPLASTVSDLEGGRQEKTVSSRADQPTGSTGCSFEPEQADRPSDLGHRVGGEQESQQEEPQSSQTTGSRCSRRGDGSPQIGLGEQSHQGALREDVWSPGRLCPARPAGDGEPRRCRRGGLAFPREQVPGRGRHVDGKLCSRRNHPLQTGPQRSTWPAKDTAGLEGLEKTMSPSVENAAAFRSGGALGDSRLQEEAGRSGTGPTAELFPLPASDRISRTQGRGTWSSP